MQRYRLDHGSLREHDDGEWVRFGDVDVELRRPRMKLPEVIVQLRRLYVMSVVHGEDVYARDAALCLQEIEAAEAAEAAGERGKP